jgi:predicted outer membrane repeat protein
LNSWSLSADGAVFGLYEGNLTIVDSSINDNYNEAGEGGAAYLDEGNLYVSASVGGQSDITYNTALNDEGGAFSIDDGKFEILGDVVFAHNTAEDGGAIYASGDGNEYFSFVGDGVEFSNNKAEYDGGALYVDGWLRIQGQEDGGVDFESNTAYDGQGGAIYQYDGYLEIKNASFTNNEAEDGGEGGGGRGGAIYAGVQDNGETNITLANLYFAANTAEYSGGAIAVENEDFNDEGYRTNFSISDSGFVRNYSGDEGGAIYIDAVVNAEISSSYFSWNESDQEGGAVFFNTYAEASEDTYLNIIDSAFTYNRTDRDGGAVFTYDALTVENSDFTSNISDDGDGGAIFAGDGGFIRTSYFTGNMADYNGGAIYSEDSVLAVYESEFVRNGWDIRGEGWIGHPINAYTYEDTNDGGAIYSDRADLLVVNSHFDSNFATYDGGALAADSDYEDYADIRVVGSSFVDNRANDEGSAIYAEEDIFVINSTFSENEADSDDYVIYSDNESVYIAMSTFVNNDSDGEGNSYIAYADEDIHIFGSIVADSSNDLILDEDSDFYDDGYNIVTDPDALQNDGMLLGVPLENKSIYVNWSDLDFTDASVANWGSYAETMKIGAESIAIRYIRGNRVDVEWLNDEFYFPKYGDSDRSLKSIYSLIGDDARGTHRGNLMDVGSYEASIMSGGGGSVDAGPSEPVVEPTPTPTPEVLDPVVANVRGFAPGSAKLTKALKATIKAEATKNAAYKAVVLRGFTVTAADFALAKARATAVKNYLLKLVPDLATKVLKGKLGQSRKVKMTFKETL